MADADATPGEGQVDNDAFISSFEGDAKGYVENKGWRGTADMLASYQGLEKLRGVPEDQLIRMPDDPAKDGAMNDVWDRLGRPEAADKYTRAVGDDFNDDVYKKISATAHAQGISDTAFSALQKDMVNLASGVVEKQEEDAAARFDEWKGKNEDGFQQAARVMATVGVDEDQLAGILSGDKAGIYDFIAKVGARSAEAKVVEGDPSSVKFTVTPDAAKVKIAEKMGDKDFMARYTNHNAKIREPAVAELTRLHEIAGGTKA